MNVSYRWLQDCSTEALGSPDVLAETLAARGFPVEEIRELGEGLTDLVVGRVRTVREHPNADRLRLCDVEAGAGVVQVVCGAPNVEAGGLYPFAPVGATLPGGMRIGRAKLRGEVSEGMLCSEKELGLGQGEAGLMELSRDLEPGVGLVEALGLPDVRLDVEVTANRSDLLSHLGVAREVARGGQRAIRLADIPGGSAEIRQALQNLAVETGAGEASGGGVRVSIEDPDRCPRYLALLLRGVRVGPSPDWLRARLRSVGLRPINNVVDATNYVLHELGQPLHAFDLGELADATIVVRRARAGERLVTLDGADRELSTEILAICDAERPVAVGGIMGGAESEVDEDTRDVLLECALFTPGPIRATRKALGMSTDASYRYERGVDPEGMRRAVLRTVEIILATAGGEVEGPMVEVCPEPFRRPEVRLRLSRVEALLGVRFGAADVRGLLEPLGFELEEDEEGFAVQVPGFRSYDVTREVDLIEEVARTHGYDAFPDTLGPFRTGTVPDHPLFRVEERVREELVASGLLEAQTPSFAPEGEGEVEISNPVSAEERFLRGRLLPGLLRRLEYNLARGNRDVRLFEIGTVFQEGRPGELPREETHVAGVLHGRRRPSHWSDPDRPVDVWDLKGLLERVARLASDRGYEVEPWPAEGPAPGESTSADPSVAHASSAAATFEPGMRFAARRREDDLAGSAGQVLPEGLDLPPWAGDVWGFELRLEAVAERPKPPTYEPLPVHPAVDRDLALLVPLGVPVGDVTRLIRARGGEHLRDVRVFDVYRGEELPEDVRSVAVHLRFRAADRTLEEREVEAAEEAVLGALKEELSVGIRGQRD